MVGGVCVSYSVWPPTFLVGSMKVPSSMEHQVWEEGPDKCDPYQDWSSRVCSLNVAQEGAVLADWSSRELLFVFYVLMFV